MPLDAGRRFSLRKGRSGWLSLLEDDLRVRLHCAASWNCDSAAGGGLCRIAIVTQARLRCKPAVTMAPTDDGRRGWWAPETRVVGSGAERSQCWTLTPGQVPDSEQLWLAVLVVGKGPLSAPCEPDFQHCTSRITALKHLTKTSPAAACWLQAQPSISLPASSGATGAPDC